MPRRRSALYRLEAYGLQNEWNLWGLATGDFTDLCRGCDGEGVEIRRPCSCAQTMTAAQRYRMRNFLCPDQCTRAKGCACCRIRCRVCHGRRFAPAPVFAEDFGDRESLAIARSMFDVDLATGRRIDMEAQALG